MTKRATKTTRSRAQRGTAAEPTASQDGTATSAGNVDAATARQETGPVSAAQTGSPEGAGETDTGKRGKGKAKDASQEARPGYMRGNLNSSYGYTDPETGATKFFGPGKNIEFPVGLGYTLGIPGARL